MDFKSLKENLIAVWKGVDQNGNIANDKYTLDNVVTKTLRKELFEYTSSMASVEASNDSFDLETSFFKQCSFKVKVLYAESEKSECIYRNNKACTPGLSYC